jgi:hypothetical protein
MLAARPTHVMARWRFRPPRIVSILISLGCPLLLGWGAPPGPVGPLPPNELPGLRFADEFFPGTTYRAGIPTQESIIGFAPGQRAASASEVERCLRAWTNAAPDRTRLVEYARSHEQRPLYYLVVTSPKNQARLAEIQAGLARLGDPRRLAEAEAQELLKTLPAVAWLAFTIHGDETEGSDAALVVIHHLLAAEDPAVGKLLEDVVVMVDPLMNPDGRERFIKMIAENRGTAPNVDDQSLVHGGYWPWGRGNHYLFDLNRDWIWCEHPETRGRVREVGRWNPQLFVDAHGMGAQETHLFSPPREPVNPHQPPGRLTWGQVFARDQARALDRHGLLYYTGEWNEEWYPGYADGWASYRGAVGILYEQARIAEDGVRRPEGRILSYRESVRHHVLGCYANLTTLQSNSRKLLEHYYQTRQVAVDPNGPYGRRTFAVLPTANRGRWQALVDLLALEGFEVYTAEREFTAPTATDHLGRETKDRRIAAGSLLIPNRQPLGHLLAAMLEFDTRLSPRVLDEERKELLRKGRSRLYDTTAWNVTMMYGLEALTLGMELPPEAKPLTVPAPGAPTIGVTGDAPAPVAYVIDGADDRSVTAAARLLERGVQVRVAEKPFRLDERDFVRGSVVITALDNRGLGDKLRPTVSDAVRESGLTAVAVSTGLGSGDLPDLGGEYFQRLEPPRIALLTRGGISAGDYGSIWFVLDQRVGIRHSHIDESRGSDLSRYNVLVVPEGRGGSSPGLATNIKEWVRSGGTLIAVGGSTLGLASDRAEFSRVRPLSEVLGRLAEYELAVFREWLGQNGDTPPPDRVWSHQAVPGLKYPWQAVEGPPPEEKELRKRDAWQSLFMPQGAILAARVETNHWLTAGCGEMLPVLASHQPILMAAEGVEAPVRFGYVTAAVKATNAPPTGELKAGSNAEAGAKKDESDKKEGDKQEKEKEKEKGKEKEKEKDKKEPPRVGWCALPEGAEMHLRLSGLLWPEASHRLANAAWLTREAYGRGQIILFAGQPTFRAATRGTTRLLLNAMIYGPGFGAAQPVRP